MQNRKLKFKLGAAALLIAALPLTVTQALAAEYWLKAAPTSVTMPDPNLGPVSVPMWGYANCTDGTFTFCGPVTVPGPALSVPSGDTTLTVHLLNGLSVPTSLVINGQFKPMAPVWGDTGLPGPRPALTSRVRSFDGEATPGNTYDYVWPNVKPGTYLYQSGTQVQVQVQMGLYGAMTKDYAAGAAYSGVAYDNQVTLLYSEIDPALHTAVDTGAYGTTGPMSTFDYQPKYFLINGNPYPHASLTGIVPAGSAGTTLVRMLNAGLTTHVPAMGDNAWDLVAEDGNAYPFRRSQSTALLPAAKTLDALIAAPALGAPSQVAIMDRRLSLSNAGASGGGMLVFLNLGPVAASSPPGNTAPVAVDDPLYTSVKGMTLTIAAPGVLANDTDTTPGPYPVKAIPTTGTTTGGGAFTLNANGSFTYTPLPGFAAADTFTYTATDGQLVSAAATVTITVTEPALPSLAVLDTFDRTDANSLGVDWSQTAGTASPDRNIQIDTNQASATATNLGGQAIWATPAFGATQGAAFTFNGSPDNSGLILKANGGSADAPANFVRVRYQPTNSGEVVVATMLGGGNTTMYVNQGALPAVFGPSDTLSAAVDDKGVVTVWQNSTFLGGVQLPNSAAWQGGGKIGIQLHTVGTKVENFSGQTLP